MAATRMDAVTCSPTAALRGDGLAALALPERRTHVRESALTRERSSWRPAVRGPFECLIG